MKVALLHYSAPPVVGGVETVLARQAQFLTKMGHKVMILGGRGEPWDERIEVKVVPELDSMDPEVLEIKAALDRGRVPPEFELLSEQIYSSLSGLIEGYDVLIAHNVASLHKNLALTAALKRLSEEPDGPRLVLWHHDLAWTTPRYQSEVHPGYPWDLLRTAWPGVKQVTISDARRKELAGLLGIPEEEIAVVPNGLDWRDFLAVHSPVAEMAETNRWMDMYPLLLAPVRITRRKNLELGLRVVAELCTEELDAGLIVSGPTGAHNPTNKAYLEELQELRKQLGLEQRVFLLAERFPQGLAEDWVNDLYRIADALFLPSREEGFGLPLLEAGLARLPIFCSDLEPLEALAGTWATYFSPDESPAEVARLISENLRENAATQWRWKVRQSYSWETICKEKIEPILEEVHGD